jgi:homoserine O-acetyltransferase/O-succinyltransferase
LVDQKHTLFSVEAATFQFANPPDELELDSGEKLGPITIAYETYGHLDESKSNAILVLHALSGDAHASALGSSTKEPGWWDLMIGPDKALDTEKYFVICSNVLGGCKGSTGPSSINPKTNRPYGGDFPVVTIHDIVVAQRYLIDHLGIEKLLSVVGGSMGGMQVLQWMISYPDRIRSAIPIATTLKHTPQQIAFNETGRQAIMADANWNGGNYYGRLPPAKGLAVARMMGHITYMSDTSMSEKFGRRFEKTAKPTKFGPVFEVENYLEYRGDNFVKRFDANSYIYLTKAMDYFDLLGSKDIGEIFKDLKAKVLVIAFKSDWLYPAYHSKEIVKACKLTGLDTTYCEINSTYGHDAFLLNAEEEALLVRHFLSSVRNNGSVRQGTPTNEDRIQNHH